MEELGKIGGSEARDVSDLLERDTLGVVLEQVFLGAPQAAIVPRAIGPCDRVDDVECGSSVHREELTWRHRLARSSHQRI